MNYEEMSDFEINKNVALLVYGGDEIDSITQKCRALKCLSRKAHIKFKDSAIVEKFDPCGDSSDAYPIIIENKIAILPNAQGTWLSYGWKKWSGKQDLSPRKEAIDENPLRAAMICFLKMKDAEK